MAEREASNSISASIFYGNKVFVKKNNDSREYCLSPYPHDLFDVNDPSHTWLIFKKQKQAIHCVKAKGNGLMAFAFQHVMGERSFLVADPRVFWHHDSRRKPEVRSSYEIIIEHSVCKLYFDLEYDVTLNPHHDGIRMVNVLMKVVAYYLHKEWNIRVTENDIVNLDSSTSSKFSRHLVYNLDGFVFQNNYSVGNFVKFICDQITNAVNQDNSELQHVIDGDSLRMLFVLNKNANKVIFCDECVYTKNRHFRLYMSTKWNKNCPLTYNFDHNSKSYETDILGTDFFLSTLITHISHENVKILEFGCNMKSIHSCESKEKPIQLLTNVIGQSPFPEIDAFINKIVYPGQVWRWCYFSSSSCLVYDIINHRFCGNVQREHRSNNIKYVVNLPSGTVYQKCYDPDCSTYSSAPVKLPVALFPSLHDIVIHEELLDSEIGDFQDDELATLLDIIEDGSIVKCINLDESMNEGEMDSLPDFGVSDLELLNASLNV